MRRNWTLGSMLVLLAVRLAASQFMQQPFDGWRANRLGGPVDGYTQEAIGFPENDLY